ncbi:MAG: trypsin-like peptidase domain-containing protein [Clostridiaceae bacterium]
MKKLKRIQAIFVALVLLLMLPLATAQASSPVQDARNGVVRIAVVDKETGEIIGWGTGFFVGEAGKPVEYIVTNAHVAGSANTYDGSDYYYEEDPSIYCVAVIDTIYNSDLTMNCQVVKIFDNVDLAILKLNAPTTTRSALTLKSAEKVAVTDTVYAMGFPWSAEVGSSEDVMASSIDYITVTKGSVTRESSTLENDQYIQIDTSINSGNSGGPLVTEDGCVVGIVSCGAIDAQNTNFALYIDYAMDFLNNSGIAYEKSDGTQAATPVPQTSTPAPEVPQAVPEEPIQAPVEEPAATPEEAVVPPDSSTDINQTPTGGPNVLLIAGGVALLALLGGGIYLLIAKKGKRGSGGERIDGLEFPPPPPESRWTCPRCGLRNDAHFCAKCGEEKPTSVFRGSETGHRTYDADNGQSGSGGFVKGGLKTSHDMNTPEDEKRSGSGIVTDGHFKKPALKSSMGASTKEKSSSTSTPAPRMKSSMHTEAESGAGRVSTESADKPLEPKAKLKSTISAPTATSTTPTDPEANSYFKRPKKL